MVEAHRRACAPVELGLCDESFDDHAATKQRRLLLSVPYQRGDSGVPLALSILQRSSTIISLEVDPSDYGEAARDLRLQEISVRPLRGSP